MRYKTRDVTNPLEGLVVIKDAYWFCENGDPTKALFYGLFPQCNKRKDIMEWRIKSANNLPENSEIVFIELAFTPQIS